MTQSPGNPIDATLLEGLLARQLSRLRLRYLTHGLAWMTAATCIALVAYYLLDVCTHLPSAVRVVLTLAGTIGLCIAAHRRIIYPQMRALSRDDAAIIVERRFPDLHERLISAVQLRDQVASGRLRDQSAPMIERLVADATAAVRDLPLDQTLDGRRTRHVGLVAAASALTLATLAALNPSAWLVFARRALGFEVAYPRLTTLVLELDKDDPDLRIVVEGRTAKVTLASGGDLAVSVQALGKVPRDVQLVVGGARGIAPVIAMTVRPEGRFKHRFARVSEPMRFFARGGDDERGNLDVEVSVVRPPAVGLIRATIQPPAYTRREPFTVATGSVEAYEGSKVLLDVVPVAPFAAGNTGNTSNTGAGAATSCKATFLESGRSLALAPVTIEDDSGTRTGFRGEFVVERSERYEINLIGEQGLRDPRPSTYTLVCVPDYPPVGRVLLPGEDNLNVLLAKAVIPLRIEARDDHGLASAVATFTIDKTKKEATVPLFAASAPTELRAASPVREAWLTDFLDLRTGAAPATASQPASQPGSSLAAVGDLIQVNVTLRDAKPPDGAVQKVPGRTLAVVGDTEFARRVAGHFRTIRDDVEQALTLQTDRFERTKELRDEGIADRSAGQSALIALGAGQGRVQSSIERIHQELMRSFTLHLMNRVDESQHAATALELWRTWHRQHGKAVTFDPAFFTLLDAERRAGRLGPMEKVLDPILAMLLRAQGLATDPAPSATRTIAEASVADNAGTRKAALQRASEIQSEIIEGLKALLASLDEWNEIQDVVTQTRAVRDKQRDIMGRTKTMSGANADPGGKAK